MPLPRCILLVEDEPLILLDLEFAVEDAGSAFASAGCVAQALDHLDNVSEIDVAILDVSLSRGETCAPIAEELKKRGIPFILHSGDLDRRDETIRSLGARLIAKPAISERVVAAAIDEFGQAHALSNAAGK